MCVDKGCLDNIYTETWKEDSRELLEECKHS